MRENAVPDLELEVAGLPETGTMRHLVPTKQPIRDTEIMDGTGAQEAHTADSG